MTASLGAWVSKDTRFPRDMVKFGRKRNYGSYNKIINCHTYIKVWLRDRKTGRKKTCWGGVMSTCVRVFMEARGQYQMSSSVTLPCILRQSLSLNLEFIDGAGLAGLRILLSPPSQLWDSKHLPWHSTFNWVLEIKVRPSCLHSKLCTDWAISLAPQSTFGDFEPHRLGDKWGVYFWFSLQVKQGQDQGELHRQMAALFSNFREDSWDGDTSRTQRQVIDGASLPSPRLWHGYQAIIYQASTQ